MDSVTLIIEQRFTLGKEPRPTKLPSLTTTFDDVVVAAAAADACVVRYLVVGPHPASAPLLHSFMNVSCSAVAVMGIDDSVALSEYIRSTY